MQLALKECEVPERERFRVSVRRERNVHDMPRLWP
jgi:hypothetical protein